MSPKMVRDYLFSSRYFRIDLIAGLLLLFVMFAWIAVRDPKYGMPVFLGLGLAGIFFLLGPLFGFFFYFITTFFRQVPLPGSPLSLNQVLGIFFCVSWLNWFLRGRTVRPRGGTAALFMAMAVYFIINCIYADIPEEGLYYLRYVIIYAFITLALASFLHQRKSLHTLFWSMLVLTFASSLLGAFELVTGMDVLAKSTSTWMGRVRINGSAPNAIVFAYDLLFAFPIGYYLFSEHRQNGPRFVAMGFSLFISLIALATFNRQTMIITAVVWLMSALSFRNRYSRLFLGLIIIIALIMGPFVLGAMIARLQTISDLYQDRSLAMRIDSIKVGMEIVKSHPWMGVGLGNFVKVWSRYVPTGTTRIVQYDKGMKTYTDMGYNQLLTEGGLIGLTFALILFASMTIILFRLRRKAVLCNDESGVNLYSCLVIMMINFLLSSGIQDTFMYVRTWIMFGIVLAAIQKGFFARKSMAERQPGSPDAPGVIEGHPALR